MRHPALFDNEVEKLHRQLIENEVVDVPSELRDVVETLWPELLHKVKPPRSEMH